MRPGFLQSLKRHLHALLAAVGPNLESVKGHAFFLPERLMEGVGQFAAQALAGHGKKIPISLAGGRFQVLAGPAVDIDDIALVIDKHGRRGVTLQHQLIGQGLETDGQFRRLTRLGPAGRTGAKRRGKLYRRRRRRGLRAPKEL